MESEYDSPDLPGPETRFASLTRTTFKSNLAIQAMHVLAALLVARALGPAGRGVYQLATITGIVTAQLAGMATNQATYRAWSKRMGSKSQLGGSSFILAGALGLAGTLCALALVLWGPLSQLELGVAPLLCALISVPFQIHLLMLGVLMVIDDKLETFNRSRVLGAAVLLGGFLLAAFFGLRPAVYVAFWSTSIIANWIPLARRIRRSLDWRGLRSLLWFQLKEGLVLQPGIVFLYLVLRVDTFLIAHYLDLADVGVYAVATNLGEVVFLATQALSLAASGGQATLPRPQAIELTTRAVRTNIGVAFLFGAVTFAAAWVGVVPVLGSGYSRVPDILGWLLGASIGVAIWYAGINPILRFGRTWTTSSIGFAALTANIGLNVLLIPRHGLVGAAAATFVAYWTGGLLVLAWLRTVGGVRVRALIPTTADMKFLIKRHL